MTGTPRRSADEQARLDAALTEMFERRITFNQLLGLRVESLDPAAVRARFDMRPELVGHYSFGRLHGGVISATLDTLGGLALMVALGERHASENTDEVLLRFEHFGTIDLRIDYLRPGLGLHYTASAEVTRLGRRVGAVLTRLYDDKDKLIATGTAAYVVG